MDKIIDLDTGWDLLKDTLNKEIDKPVKSVMAKRVTGTLDGSGCFGCPPNGDGTRVNGEPDGRCKGDGSGKTGGKGGSKGGSKGGGSKPATINKADILKAKVGDRLMGYKDAPDGILIRSVKDYTEGKSPKATQSGQEYEVKVTTVNRGGDIRTEYRMRPGHLTDSDTQYFKDGLKNTGVTHIVSNSGKFISKAPDWDSVYGKNQKGWVNGSWTTTTNVDPYGLK